MLSIRHLSSYGKWLFLTELLKDGISLVEYIILTFTSGGGVVSVSRLL